METPRKKRSPPPANWKMSDGMTQTLNELLESSNEMQALEPQNPKWPKEIARLKRLLDLTPRETKQMR